MKRVHHSASSSSAVALPSETVVAVTPAAASSSSTGGRANYAGSFIDTPQLRQLSAMLKAIDAGDRIIKGRLELYSVARRTLTKQQKHDLLRRAPDSLKESPLGPMSTDSAQNLLANLVSLMSMLFVDYDCTSITPYDFETCPDNYSVVNMINHQLASVVDRVHSGFMPQFWQAVQDSIDIINCEIYAFMPSSGTFEPTDNSLSSFHYFFTDVQRGRILFIGSVTKSRGSVRGGMDSESDVALSQDTSSIASKEKDGSSMGGSSPQEGDLAFGSDASGDDPMVD